MVRLKVSNHPSALVRTIFQFLVVRLKAGQGRNDLLSKLVFQFLVVRLKEWQKNNIRTGRHISIPCGSIKSIHMLNIITVLRLFQFLVVRLKDLVASKGKMVKTFQFLVVRLKVWISRCLNLSKRYFNSLWFD